MVPYGTGHIARQLLFALQTVDVCESVGVYLARSHSFAIHALCTHVCCVRFSLLDLPLPHRANVSSYINDFSTVAFYQLPPSTETIHSNSTKFSAKFSSVLSESPKSEKNSTEAKKPIKKTPNIFHTVSKFSAHTFPLPYSESV